MRVAIETLTFDLLDDICLALEGKTVSPAELPTVVAEELGPVMELHHVVERCEEKAHSAWLSLAKLEDLIGKRHRGRAWSSRSGDHLYIPISELERQEIAWTDLVIRLKAAAGFAGFSNEIGAKLAAAIGELHGNILEHSHAPGTGYIAVAAKKGFLDFVVADFGIGVLQSLNSNPAYGWISDSGTALEEALRQGVSRHLEPGRGLGFRPIFVGLANISRQIRFRSGDYGRVIERLPSGELQARTVQLAELHGFFCSVHCDVKASMGQ